VGGKRYHHLIDPETLMPADHYRAVTVVAGDSAVADYLSTELFLLPYAESRALADSLDGVEAIWVMPDGEVKITRGLEAMLKSRGATNVNP
jgi:thiamine biosynthesis lipoprotein